jgi:hypothetical protein
MRMDGQEASFHIWNTAAGGSTRVVLYHANPDDLTPDGVIDKVADVEVWGVDSTGNLEPVGAMGGGWDPLLTDHHRMYVIPFTGGVFDIGEPGNGNSARVWGPLRVISPDGTAWSTASFEEFDWDSSGTINQIALTLDGTGNGGAIPARIFTDGNNLEILSSQRVNIVLSRSMSGTGFNDSASRAIGINGLSEGVLEVDFGNATHISATLRIHGELTASSLSASHVKIDQVINLADYDNPSPNNGDLWLSGTDLLIRITGSTYKVNLSAYP